MSKPRSTHSTVDRSLGCLQFLHLKRKVSACIPACAFLKDINPVSIGYTPREGTAAHGVPASEASVDPARQYPGEAELLLPCLLFSERLHLHIFSPLLSQHMVSTWHIVHVQLMQFIFGD